MNSSRSMCGVPFRSSSWIIFFNWSSVYLTSALSKARCGEQEVVGLPEKLKN